MVGPESRHPLAALQCRPKTPPVGPTRQKMAIESRIPLRGVESRASASASSFMPQTWHPNREARTTVSERNYRNEFPKMGAPEPNQESASDQRPATSSSIQQTANSKQRTTVAITSHAASWMPPRVKCAHVRAHGQNFKISKCKTYNSGDSLVVTHPTTNPPI